MTGAQLMFLKKKPQRCQCLTEKHQPQHTSVLVQGMPLGFFLYFFFLLTLLLLHQVLILSANYLQVSVFYKTLLSFICVLENSVLYKFHCLPVISIS